MIAYCIFYGNKYPYSNVVHLQREFKKYDIRLRCDYIKDFSKIKAHWHKLKYFDNSKEDTIIVDIDQTVVGDISDMINYPVNENELVTYKNWSAGCPINGGWYKFKYRKDYSIALFHQKPEIHDCLDHDIVKENWI